jgi:tetratricopeptide (TPR) repeat protein
VSGGPGPLERVGYISITEARQRAIGDFTLDPAILLPVELPPGETAGGEAGVTWEAIVAGTLKVLAYDTGNANAEYYRRFVLAVKPDILNELTHLGITSARNGSHETAIEVFRALEGLFPGHATTSMNLALVYDERSRALEKLDRMEQAEELQNQAFEAYKRALAADPSEPAIHYNAAFFYLHQRSFEKAREHLVEFLKGGKDKKMVTEARRIVKEIDTQGLVDGLFRSAYDFIRMGREEKGIEAIRRFLELHHDVPNAWFLLGWGLRRLGRYSEGADAFRAAISLAPPHPDLLNELSICLMEMGDLEESGKVLRQALEIEPENVKIISNLGIVALKGGNLEDAAGFFRTVLEIEPEDPVAARYLGIISEKKSL